MVGDRWLSVDKTALYLGVKRAAIYKWIERKNMPGYKVGRLCKFRKEEGDRRPRSDHASEDKDPGR